MVQKFCNHAALVVLGIFVGGLVAVGWFGVGQPRYVHATATHGEGNFAIATGPADNDIEALYFLDFLTGDLRAAVVNRRTAGFSALFERNIQQDFTGISKNPKYLMVTGLANLPRGRGPTQLGNSLIYVAEASSGQVCAYALPFSSPMNNAGKEQRGSLELVASGTFRTTLVRD